MIIKKNQLVFIILLFTIIIISENFNNYDYRGNKSTITNSLQFIKTKNPKLMDGITDYKYNPLVIIDETFQNPSDLSEWNRTTENGASITISGGNLIFSGQTDGFFEWPPERAWAVYLPDIPQFYIGNLTFDYNLNEKFSVSLTLQIDDNDDDVWDDVWSDSGDSGGWQKAIINFDGTNYNTRFNNFRFRFYFQARNASDVAYVDNLKISTWEFVWEENNGDIIEENETQEIRAYIVPSFSNFNRNNVTIKYTLNDPFLSNPINDTMTDLGSQSYFNYIFSDSQYNSSDTIYYKIIINNNDQSIFSSTNTVNFKCYDRTPPTISQISHNATNYNSDVLITCYVEDNQYGDGLLNVTMYINNGTEADKSDILILSNRSGSIPSGGGYFGFVIDKKYLSARQGEELHFKIYAYDKASPTNENHTKDLWFSLTDDVSPSVSFKGDNAYPSTGKIECTRNLIVNYSITEPLAGSGIKSIELLVLISNKSPSNNYDYNFSVSPVEAINLNGGIFNFIIDTSHYRYNKTIYCFINATDNAGNNYTQYKNYIEYGIVDLTPPSVIYDPDNRNPKGYHLPGFYLNFTFNEPLCGAGIKNNTKLYYKINDPFLTNPTILELPVSKYGGTVSFNITNGGWNYKSVIYYRIDVSDNDNNIFLSPIFNFTITDQVKPCYVEDIKNLNGWVYNNFKLLNFTVYDPDYDFTFKSSGIANIILYYKAGSAPNPYTKDYDGSLIYNGVITKTKAKYTFNLSLTYDMYKNGPNIYYVINVSDIEGNYNISSAQYFTLYSKPYISESIIGPDRVIGKSDFRIQFSLNFYCNFWYKINDSANTTAFITYSNNFSSNFVLPEGNYKIIFNFTRTNCILIFYVEIDLTPPDKITTISFKIINYKVIVLTWEAPDGIDSETIYKIYRSTNPDVKITNENFIGEVKVGDELIFEDGDIKEGNTYYYIIVAVDRVGNISEKSEVIKVEVPANPLPMIILIVIILAALGGIGYLTYHKISVKKRERIFSQVDLKDLKLEDEDLTPKEKPQWTSIKTTAEPKTIKEEGFEFLGEVEEEVIPIESNYWKLKTANLFEKTINLDLSNDYGKAIRNYLLIKRMAEKMNNIILIEKIRERIAEIYKQLNES
ncbi:MAG: hypothetical protein ACTSRP_16265 [Candidatus Helarchaeota archaeon]